VNPYSTLKNFPIIHKLTFYERRGSYKDLCLFDCLIV
jgi:hypothetical protein